MIHKLGNLYVSQPSKYQVVLPIGSKLEEI